MRQETTGVKLRKIPLHGTRGVLLGHIVSSKGLKVDKAKIEVIQNLPLPGIVRDLMSFLGHVGFYQRFMQDFAKVSKPLTALLCKDKDFIIDKEGKCPLIEAPILQSPNWDIPFKDHVRRFGLRGGSSLGATT